MRIETLCLRNFRNYEEATAEFVPGVNLLVGKNANGKTNLLEAISYLSTAKAFRAKREQELLRFGSEFAELSARVYSREREQNLRILLFEGRRPRQLWLNGVKQKTAKDLVGLVPSVLFCPEDLLVLKKGAQPRRKLLDHVIVQLRPNYDSALSEYQRLLEEKGALLKDWRDNPYMLEILPEYNQRMAQVGALVISYRARYIKALGDCAGAYHREFSGGLENLTLTYKTVSNLDDPFAPPEVLRQKLLEHQAAHERAELDSGQCLSGPHKDDFEACINGLPVSAYGSQGQTRTAAISIKLAERELLRRDCGEEPILLLDDVLSELDAGRQDFVLNQLKEGQVFITCCEPDRLTSLGQVLHIEKGKIL